MVDPASAGAQRRGGGEKVISSCLWVAVTTAASHSPLFVLAVHVGCRLSGASQSKPTPRTSRTRSTARSRRPRPRGTGSSSVLSTSGQGGGGGGGDDTCPRRVRGARPHTNKPANPQFWSHRRGRHGEHKAKRENSRKMIRLDNVTSCAHSARTRRKTPIPGAPDHVEWDIQSETAGLSPALTKPNGSGNVDPVRMAVWWKVCRHPASCADRDLMVTFCGPTAAECAVAVGTIDEVDGHPHLCNPRHAGVGCQDALNEHQSHGAARTAATPLSSAPTTTCARRI